MIRSFSVVACTIFAVAGLANHDPITSFTEGNYLGEGLLVSTTGTETNYASYLVVKSEELKLNFVREGGLFTYHLYFDFGNNGFFTVEATENSATGEVLTHYGEGYCANAVQCHFSFDLEYRQIEETISFVSWENRIYTIGSMKYFDDSGDEQTIYWQESLMKIDDGCDNNEESTVANR